MREPIPYGEPFIHTGPLQTAGAQTHGTGLTIAAGDATLLTNSQAATNVLARSIEFTSGSEEPKVGDVIVGATSTDRASYLGAKLSSGTWAGGDAAGEVFLGALDSAAIPAFQSENLNIEGGTANVMTIGAALKAAGIFAEIGTSANHAVALTGPETETDYGDLILVDAAGGPGWDADGFLFSTFGHPLAADARGVKWAGYVGLHNTLALTGQFTDTQTVVIGGKTYTTQTTLTDVDGNVDIGGDATEDTVNLACALGLWEAIDFTSMSELPSRGDVISGDTSSQTATVEGVLITSGTVAGGDAAGWIMVSGASGALQAEDITNDTTTTANVATIAGDVTGAGTRYAASMTAHTLVRGAAVASTQMFIWTLDGIIPQRIPCTETQTNAAWDNAAMIANIDSSGTWVDLPDTNNWDSPSNDDDANDHWVEITDENGNTVGGYIGDSDVAGGSAYESIGDGNSFDPRHVRLTLATGSLFRLNLTGSSRLKYAVTGERQVPVRVLSAASGVNIDANVQQVNDVTITGDGSATPFQV